MQIKSIASLGVIAALSGCASLPSSGPTGRAILKSASTADSGQTIKIIGVETISDLPLVASASNQPPLPTLVTPPTDMVGPGDVLDINIYEAGVTLFSGASSPSMNAAPINAGVQVQKLPPSRVDDNGNINVPYAGTIHVAGSTISQIEGLIRRSLRGMSQNPQVLISISQAISNSVIVGGEVARPGRLVLQTNRETLSDVIALAGGVRGNTKDLLVRVVRAGQNVNIRLTDLADHPEWDVTTRPGDRLTLINDPRTFSVIGASGRVEQIPFARSSVSLAEAVATAGGVNPNLGDPAAIFVFRYEQDAQGSEVPVVYHLNMSKAGSFFLAQRFKMLDKDVLYFGNAAANQPSKLIQLVSQLFSPILTVTSTVQVLQNSNR